MNQKSDFVQVGRVAFLFANFNYQGIGSVQEKTVYFDGSRYSDPSVMTCSGSVPGSVNKKSFTWGWYVMAINGNMLEDELWIGNTGSHAYYILLGAPQSPMTVPWTSVLDYACDWASGVSDSSNVCIYILDNGFEEYYTWDWQCHRLSSDFVRLVSGLGVSASQHLWASKNQSAGDMAYQRTISIDPVGPFHDQGVVEWSWHQWSESVSAQRDPSTATSKSGNWGSYEDYLFSHYLVKYNGWVANQAGQSSGCEAPNHRYYTSSPPLYS